VPSPGSSLDRMLISRLCDTIESNGQILQKSAGSTYQNEMETQPKIPGPRNHSGGALGTMKKCPAVVGNVAPTRTDWREWAKRIQQETDPQKVFALARQLFAEFDDEQIRKSLPPKAE
jgi:hypothetical protein